MRSSDEALILECQRIENFCLWNAATHFQAESLLKSLAIGIGTTSAVVAAASAWLGFHDSGQVAGVLAVAGGVLNSVAAFWDISGKRSVFFAKASAFKILENDARRLWQTWRLADSQLDFLAETRILAQRYNKLCRENVSSSDLAYRLAGRKIRREVFAPDEPEKRKIE